MLGHLHLDGNGVAEDPSETVRLWRLAVAQGHVGAQYNLGVYYSDDDEGVARDYVEAARLFGLAAAQGCAIAQFRLGHLYAQGNGVAQDCVEAARLFRLAAAHEACARAALTELSCERAYVSACCMGCGATRKLKTCAKCKVARFCGQECVRRSWAEHKPHCKKWEAEQEAEAAAEAP